MAGSVIKDIFAPHERAAAMSFFIMGPLLGPVLGPLTGGFVAEGLGYKWVFIITSIISAVAGVYAFFLPMEETYHPLLRTRLIERSAGDGLLRSGAPKASDEEKNPEEVKERRVKYEEEPEVAQKKQKKMDILIVNMTRPFALFFHSFVLFILALFMAMYVPKLHHKHRLMTDGQSIWLLLSDVRHLLGPLS